MNELRAEKERIEEELQNYSSYLKSVRVLLFWLLFIYWYSTWRFSL